MGGRREEREMGGEGGGGRGRKMGGEEGGMRWGGEWWSLNNRFSVTHTSSWRSDD